MTKQQVHTAPHSHRARTNMSDARRTHKVKRISRADRRLTESKLMRAKMAKVEGLSHTHLVLNEWTGTDLQLRADHEPSSEELHREGEREQG